MACSLKTLGSIYQLDEVVKVISGNDKRDLDLDDSWQWPDENEVLGSSGSSSGQDNSWLSKACISISPHAETLAVGFHKHLFIFSAKWYSQKEGDDQVKYMLKWEGDPRSDPTDLVTSVLCLPMAAQGRVSSSHFAPDWTTVVVGFESGSIRFFTESGGVLLTEKLHCGPVWNIKCQTTLDSSDTRDELHVFYRDTVCSIPGIVLSNTLRACRNQLAKVLAGVSGENSVGGLACSKWQTGEQAAVCDAVVLGLRTPSLWSHLMGACLDGGSNARYSPLPLPRSDVIAAGSRPFVALHSIREGTPTPFLPGVAKAVASKIKDTIGGWLIGGKRELPPEIAKDKPALEPAEPMTCRFGLTDLHRKGERIICCPHLKLCAVCDSFGRVSLVDSETGVALRMWKGYRDAQCAFIPATVNRSANVSSLFLAIYAPKKGIVEVWALRNGPKVASFQFSKNGRLFYLNHGLFDVSSASHKINNLSLYPCVLIDENGMVKYITIPFYIMLSVINNKKAKDLHILKQIKRLISNSNCEEEFSILLKQINSSDVLIQVCDLIMKSKHTNTQLLKTLSETVSQRLLETGIEFMGSEESVCNNIATNLKQILVIFEFFMELRDVPPTYVSVVPSSSESCDKGLDAMLRVSEKEVDNLLLNLKLLNDCVKPRVTFDASANMLPLILSCFHKSFTSQRPLRIDTNCKHIHTLGELICQSLLYSNCSIDKWRAVVEDFLVPQDLLTTAIRYWLSKPHSLNPVNEVMNFSVLVTTICSMADMKEINFWWSDIRNIINSSNNTAAALSAVYVLRSISLADEDRLYDKGDGDWVAISEESCIWTQMIAQLEAITLLQSAIRYKNKNLDSDSVPCLEVRMPELTLENFLSSGPGLVVEVVAQWIGSWGVAIEWVCQGGLGPQAKTAVTKSPALSPVIDGCVELADTAREAVLSSVGQEGVMAHLHDLISKFPHTLSVNNLVANLAWEYSLAWTKDKSKVLYLHYALRALQAIEDIPLLHGLCCLMWSAHLFGGYESAVRLIEKVGRTPNQRLCLQEVGVSDTALAQLLQFYVSFFDEFVRSAVCLEEDGKEKDWLIEALWDDPPPSLTRLATTKQCKNINLLFLKQQCSEALYLLVSFPIKFSHPVTSLFDFMGDVLLLNDVLNQAKVPEMPINQKLKESRLSFLRKIITSVIQNLSEEVSESELNTASEWLGRCYKIASDWTLDLEDLRRHQVSLLYFHNHDRLAEEVMASINDKEQLGSELLNIVGRRLKTLLSRSARKEVSETMSLFSPSVTHWLQDLECCDFEGDITTIKQMSETTLNLLPTSSSNYNLSKLLFDSLHIT